MLAKTYDSRTRLDAERWYVRLQAPDCSTAERLDFERWRAVPEHAAAFAATQGLWQALGELADRPEVARLSRQVIDDVRQQRSHSRRTWLIAASVILAIASGTLLSVHNRQAPVTYATAADQRRTVDLSDGSQVVLNVDSEIAVRFGTRARQVTLHRGEALFSVAHDRSRPFSVAAADGAVVALGTRFQVRSEIDRVTVTLLEGRVNVERDNEREHAQLVPGDQVRYAPAVPGLKRRSVDVDSVSSWSTGRLQFRATALAEVLDEVNRYSASKIRLADASLGDVPVNGTFAIGDARSVVDALQALLDIQVARRNGDFLLSRR
ncbi:MAG: FecR domain-containing protein [Pseudomonadota bacterium]|nr:FecR domain-containing protein [Pseudomonadota bacterium]